MIHIYGSEQAVGSSLVSLLEAQGKTVRLFPGGGDPSSHEGEKPEAIVIVPPSAELGSAEDHREAYYHRIATFTRETAGAAAESQTPVLFISSVFVFSGEGKLPFAEEMEPAPVNVYGDACFLAEKYLAESGVPCCILRSGEVLGAGDWDMVSLIKRSGKGAAVPVPEGTIAPVSAGGLAAATAELVIRGGRGTWHYGAQDRESRVEVARYILSRLEASGRWSGLPFPEEKKHEDIPLDAERLLWSVLDWSKIRGEFQVIPESWQAAADSYIEELSLSGHES